LRHPYLQSKNTLSARYQPIDIFEPKKPHKTGGSARITADAIKTSAGSLHTFPVCREKSIVRSVEYLKESGLKIICANEKTGVEAPVAPLTGPSVLILGSEEKGISRELLALSDYQVRIPMTGNITSLNVSVASGILLYEIKRQRSQPANQ
jgi:23S rRNA (guanosine2251-2'-O)-methyltransferase